jgi:hypothetical protein
VTARRTRLAGTASLMAAAIVARVAVAAAYAALLVVALPPAQSAYVFQLFFLQTGLVALLSASAYARAASLTSQDRDVSASLASFLRFVILGAALAVLLGLVALPAAPGADTAMQVTLLMAMVLGGVMAAVGSLIQGVAVVADGPARAFGPVLAVCVIALGVIALGWGPQGLVVVVLGWAFFQSAAALVILAASPAARSAVGHLRPWRGRGAASDHFASVGVLNGASVAVAYGYREVWAAGQSSEVAANSFLLLRWTELAYQLAYTGLASLPGLVRRRARPLFGGRRTSLALVLAGVTGCILGVLPALFWSQWSLAGFVMAEALVAPARCLSIVCLIILLAEPSTRWYLLAVASSTLASLALFLVPDVQQSPYGLQVFQSVGGPLVLAVTLWAVRQGAASARAAAAVPT